MPNPPKAKFKVGDEVIAHNLEGRIWRIADGTLFIHHFDFQTNGSLSSCEMKCPIGCPKLKKI